MTQPAPTRLLLDEMFSPVIAAALRELGHNVTAVAGAPPPPLTEDWLS
jgi:hypothetical protein